MSAAGAGSSGVFPKNTAEVGCLWPCGQGWGTARGSPGGKRAPVCFKFNYILSVSAFSDTT